MKIHYTPGRKRIRDETVAETKHGEVEQQSTGLARTGAPGLAAAHSCYNDKFSGGQGICSDFLRLA
jgi:hypothetical protein